MKATKFIIIILMALIAMPSFVKAQETNKLKSYWVHEDVVKPSMVAAYESICGDLISNMKKHKIQGWNSIVTNTRDNRYLWVSPIDGMADIDDFNVFKTLSEKMGAEKVGALFDKMDKCYDIEQNYVIHLDEDLSYMPDGITQTPEGLNYRQFHYYRYTPANEATVKKNAANIKKLFKEKGSKLYYRVYKSGFGNRGAYYMVAIAAEDAADYDNKVKANNELLGDEWMNAYMGFMSNLDKYEVFEGMMRPDMAYSPSN